jgi:hypothetical protein
VANNKEVLLLEPALTELVDICSFISGYQLLTGKFRLPHNLNPDDEGRMLARNTLVH